MAQQFTTKTLDLLSLIDKAAPPPQMIENEPVVCTDLVLNSLYPPNPINKPTVCTDLVLNSLYPPTTTAPPPPPPPPPQILNSLYPPSPINIQTVCTDLVLNSLYSPTNAAPPPPPPPQVSTVTTVLNSSLYPPPITTNHLFLVPDPFNNGTMLNSSLFPLSITTNHLSLVSGPFNNARRFTPKTLDLLSLIDKAAPFPPPVVSSEEENTKQPENEPASATTVCTDLVLNSLYPPPTNHMFLVPGPFTTANQLHSLKRFLMQRRR